MSSARKRVVVFISGSGSNMMALVKAATASDYPAEIIGVISDKADAGGLAKAAAEGIATFDLLAPAYAYKEDWADAGVAVGDYAGGFTWAGRLYAGLYLALLRPRLKAALEALPGLFARARAFWPAFWPAFWTVRAAQRQGDA